MYSVTLIGFQSKEEAVEWLNWYEGQGEQDAIPWLDYGIGVIPLIGQLP